MSPESKAVFLSYASQDSEAARKICDALRAAGIEVWFDQSELVGGDAWDAKIRKQIKECALFVPIISANTQARREGYFRLEWKLADDRTQLMARGTPFVLPLCIDDTPEAQALAPDSFLAVQWVRVLPTDATAMVRPVRAMLAGDAGAGGPAVRIEPALPVQPALAATTVGEVRGDPRSVAVLAFTNLSDERENEYFSEGIAEELLAMLANVPGLKVIARTSSFYFKGKHIPAPEIARALGVIYLIQGSVRRAAGKVRIAVQLFHAADGFTVWSDSFTRDLRDVFAVQEEIAGIVAAQLKLKLAPARAPRQVDPEAHRLLLEARFLWNQRSEPNFDRAEALLTRALAIDSGFPEGHSLLANVWLMRATYRQLDGKHDVHEELRGLRMHASRAIELDATLEEPQAAQAYGFLLENRPDVARNYFHRALQLRPDNANVRYWHGIALLNDGDVAGAAAENERARRLDPMAFIVYHTSAESAHVLGRFAEAAEFSARAHALRPGGFPQALASLGLVSWLLGQRADAVEHARAARQTWPQGPRWLADPSAIWVLRQAGLEQEARDYAEQVLPAFAPDSYQRGFVLLALGRFEEALPYLANHPPLIYYTFAWFPALDAWRDDPRFSELLRRIGYTERYERIRATRPTAPPRQSSSAGLAVQKPELEVGP